MSDLRDKPGFYIRRLQQLAVARFMEKCGARDVTPVQYAALIAIRDNPGLDATRISAHIFFDRSTIGSVLERLENKGWIARSGKARDRRVKIIDLTPAGETLLRDIDGDVEQAQRVMLDPLNEDERIIFLNFMRRIVDKADAPETCETAIALREAQIKRPQAGKAGSRS